MIFFIIITILSLFFVCLLIKVNLKLKTTHLDSIDQLQSTIYSLHLKEKELNDKLIISNSFDNNFKQDFKTIGTEIVTLQEIFLEIISEKK